MPEDEETKAYHAGLKHPHRLRFFAERLESLSPYQVTHFETGRYLAGLSPELIWGISAYDAWSMASHLHNAIVREHGAIGYEAYEEKVLEAIRRGCRKAGR